MPRGKSTIKVGDSEGVGPDVIGDAVAPVVPGGKKPRAKRGTAAAAKNNPLTKIRKQIQREMKKLSVSVDKQTSSAQALSDCIAEDVITMRKQLIDVLERPHNIKDTFETELKKLKKLRKATGKKTNMKRFAIREFRSRLDETDALCLQLYRRFGEFERNRTQEQEWLRKSVDNYAKLARSIQNASNAFTAQLDALSHQIQHTGGMLAADGSRSNGGAGDQGMGMSPSGTGGGGGGGRVTNPLARAPFIMSGPQQFLSKSMPRSDLGDRRTYAVSRLPLADNEGTGVVSDEAQPMEQDSQPQQQSIVNISRSARERTKHLAPADGFLVAPWARHLNVLRTQQQALNNKSGL